MRRPLILLAIVAFVAAQNGNFPDKLFCNRLYGNFISCCDKVNLAFERPLQIGDKITINGTAGPAAGFVYMRINIRDSTGDIISYHMRTEIPTDWPYDFSKLLYSTYIGGWGRNEFSVRPFALGDPIQFTIHYTGATYDVYYGSALIMSYALRHSTAIPLMYLELNGQYTTNWVQMDCINPPTTTAAPTTTRRRGSGNGHGHGHGNGHGHHHHHHHGKFDSSSSSEGDSSGGRGGSSSSSSSQETCDR